MAPRVSGVQSLHLRSLQQRAAPRPNLQQAAACLSQAEIDLKAMSKMASDSEGGPFPSHAVRLASQVVDMALKSAMLRTRGLTQEDLVGQQFSILYQRLKHAGVKYAKQDLPGDVFDIQWLEGTLSRLHAQGLPTNTYTNQDVQRAALLAGEILQWAKSLSGLEPDKDRIKREIDADDTDDKIDKDDHYSCGSYGTDFEDFEGNESAPKSARDGEEQRPVEAWGSPPRASPAGLDMEHVKPDEAAVEETLMSKKTLAFLSVASEDAREGLETVVQYTNMARRLRAKGLTPRAIRMMERALLIAHGFAQGHPTLALEACKVRLNFAAYLSEGFRNREAMKVIKEAQESLMQLLEWAGRCPPDDLAVQALSQEARALHCCAVVAEATALDCFEDDGQPPPEEMSEELKEAARLTISSMPADHPLPSLVRKALGRTAPTQPKRCSSAKIPRKPVSPIVVTTPLARTGGPFAAAPALFTPEPELETPMTPMTPMAERGMETPSRHKRGEDHDHDVFKQYLRDLETARVAHLLSLSDDWETQARKKLENNRRQAKFELELVDMDELKEKRYSKQGHKVFMCQMQKMNKSASDPAIRRGARRERTAPETFQLKKLSRKIKAFVKPPAATPQRRKVDVDLAGNVKTLHKQMSNAILGISAQ